MTKEEMNQMLQLNEKAKKMDRLGNEDAALEIYLEILEHYQPHLYMNFERPAIILEKKRRFQEALEICQKALELIENERISGDAEKCQSRIDKLLEKVAPAETAAPASKAPKANKKTSIILAILFALGVIAYLVLNSQSQYDDVYVDVSEMERQSELEGSVFTEEPSDEVTLHEITQTMIDFSKNAVEIHTEVTSANIAVNDSTLGFAIFVSPGTDKSECEKFGEEMVKALGVVASTTHLDLTPPTPVSLGGLYQEYDVIISVGTSSSDIIAKGTKTTAAKKINWRK
ncbi:MAG: hypothetical protein JXO44_07090 [Clostridia bacterium]|nr:hypothetical protein [Clostridia bacterium]